MSEYDDLTLSGLLNQAIGNPLSPLVIKRRDGIVEDYSACSPSNLDLGQERTDRDTGLLALAENIAWTFRLSKL